MRALQRRWGAAVRLGILALLGITLGVAMGARGLLPQYLHATELSPRAAAASGPEQDGADFSASWSLHPEDLLSFLVPEIGGYNVPGVRSLRGPDKMGIQYYWGRNPFKINTPSFGLVPILLAGLALFFIRGRPVILFMLALAGCAPQGEQAAAS